MKKALLLLTALCFLLAGCSKTAGNAPSPSASPSASPAAVESTEPATASPAVSPSPLPADAPTGGDTTRLSETYVDIIKSGDYFMKAQVQNDSGINAFSVSVCADSTAMETVSDGTVYNTIIKEGTTYMIDHQNKMVFTSSVEVAPSASHMAGDNLSTDGITFSTKGTAEFSGEALPFEEYQTPAGGTMRFYFRDTALFGIETRDGDKVLSYKIEEISKGHRPAMHQIPQDYPLIDMAALGG